MFDGIYGLLTLFKSAGGKIEGRMRIHKTIYILQALGYPFQEEYSYYRYGPYSPQLQFELDLVSDQNLIDVERAGNGYIYSLNKQGSSFLGQLNNSELVKKNIVVPHELIAEIISKDAYLLELASTLMYLLNSRYTKEEALEKAKNLKPHLLSNLDEAKDWIGTLRTSWAKRNVGWSFSEMVCV